MLAAAQKVFDEVKPSDNKPLPSTSDHASYLDEEAESMRWFLLPSEAQQVLLGVTTPTTTPPFQPRHYPAPKIQNVSNTNSSSAIEDASSTKMTLLWKSRPQEKSRTINSVAEQCDVNGEELRESEGKKEEVVKFHCPPKNIYKPTTEVLL